MEKYIRFMNRISNAAGFIGGALIIITLIMICAEMVLRGAFNSTLYIASEYTGYSMLTVLFLTLSFTLKEKGHIRVLILNKVLKGRKGLILEIYAFTVGTIVSGTLTITTFLFFFDALVSKSQGRDISGTYLAFPKFFMTLGLGLLTLQFV